jgi:hypothetical protein
MDEAQTAYWIAKFWSDVLTHQNLMDIAKKGKEKWSNCTLTLTVIWEKQSQSQLSQVFVARYVPEDPALENAGFKPVCSSAKQPIALPVLIYLASDSDIANPLRGEIDVNGNLTWV